MKESSCGKPSFMAWELLSLYKDNDPSGEDQQGDEQVPNSKLTLLDVQDMANLKDKIFVLQNPDSKHYSIQRVNFQMDEQTMVMIEFLDISNTILHHQAKQENRFLSMVNAFVSHELRNPL